MTSAAFDSVYATAYDDLYGDKDYAAECDLIETVFDRFGDGKIRSILDLGCGTGNHAIPLADRGYEVTGVDFSAEMLVEARRKAAAAFTSPTFLEGDVRKLDLKQSFDAVLMMFAVLGYQVSNDDVQAALDTVSRHLRPGGLFIFDVWYGPAVLAMRPGDRVKTIAVEGGRVIRTASATLDIRHHLCDVRYHVLRLEGNRVDSETEETHFMRYFFPMELESLLNQTGIELRSLTTFPELDAPADETSWNVLGVGQRVRR